MSAGERASAQPIPCRTCGAVPLPEEMRSVDVRASLAAYFQAFADAVHARDNCAAVEAFVPLLRYANGSAPDRDRGAR